MSAADNDSPAADKRADNEERRQHWQRLRRRLLGGGAMLLLVILIWRLGGPPTPPDIEIAAPGDEPPALELNPELAAVRQRLEEDDSREEESFWESLFRDDASDDDGQGDDDTPYSDSDSDFSEESELADADSDVADSDNGDSDSNSESERRDNSESAESDSDSDSVLDSSENESEKESIAAADSPVQDSPSPSSQNSQGADDLQTAVAAKSPFAVQIGSFSKKKNAMRAVKKLREKQFAADAEEVNVGGEKRWRVRAFGYASRAEATLAQKQLEASGHPKPLIVDLR